MKDGAELSVEDVLEKSKTGLARFKVPKFVKFTSIFPMTVTGKIRKVELREWAMLDFPELKHEIEN